MIRAAQYVRMSTERQDFSIESQMEALGAYAALMGYEIVDTYADEGQSGLGIVKRHALQRLLADVISGAAGFSRILVYDVSRWGRFQNPDQAAHYEFLCSEAGITVEYCAESFLNDGSPSAILMKHFKRAMAAEFSRDLSNKTKQGKYGLRRLGYWVGGKPGYGFRRQAVTLSGKVLGVREDGQWNNNQSERTRSRLVLGPPHEIAVVRRIYRMFLQGERITRVARLLNDEGIIGVNGTDWTRDSVREILSNEKYAGTIICGRQEQTLSSVAVHKDPKDWIRVDGAVEPIISRSQYRKSILELERRRLGPTDDDLIGSLQALLAEHGYLTALLIRRHASYPLHQYDQRFGTLRDAFERAGYVCPKRNWRSWDTGGQLSIRRDRIRPSDEQMTVELKAIWATYGQLNQQTINAAPDARSWAIYTRHFGGPANMYAHLEYPISPIQKRSLGSVRARL